MKVYCKDCRYLTCHHCDGFTTSNCACLDNIAKNTYINWYSKEEKKEYKELPEIINKNNDCKWYKKETSKILLLIKKIIRIGVNM